MVFVTSSISYAPIGVTFGARLDRQFNHFSLSKLTADVACNEGNFLHYHLMDGGLNGQFGSYNMGPVVQKIVYTKMFIIMRIIYGMTFSIQRFDQSPSQFTWCKP